MHCSQSRAGQQWVWGLLGKWTRKLVSHGLRDSCTGGGLHLRACQEPPPVTTPHQARHTLGGRGPSKTEEWQLPQPAFLSKVPVTAAPSPFLQVYSFCILSLWVHCLPFFPHLTRMTSPSMPEGGKGWTTAHTCLGPQMKTTCNWHIFPSALNEYREYLHSTISSNSEARLLGFKFWLWPHLEIKMETIAVLASQSCYED